jgi:GTP pyrophosphokinase
MTSAQQNPNRDWLKFVKTSKAKSKISSYIRQAERQRALELGKEMLEKEINRLGLDHHIFMGEGKILPPAQASGYMSVDSLFIALGLGKVKAANFLAKMAPKEAAEAARKKSSIAGAIKRFITRTPQPSKHTGIKIQGIDDVLIRFAQCCNPVPGDDIRGFISRGRGLIVHTVDCPNAMTIGLDSERGVAVEWDIKEEKKSTHRVSIVVETQNKPGMLSKVTGVIGNEGSNISEVNVKIQDEKTGHIYITVEVSDLKQLQEMMNAVMRVKGVKSVERIKNKRLFTKSGKPGSKK